MILDKLKGLVKCLEVTINAKRELRKSLFLRIHIYKHSVFKIKNINI